MSQAAMAQTPPGHWDYIDALRGLAAFGVLVLHTAILFPRLPFAAAQIARLGLHGVQLFFMVSAITLASSWQSRARNEEHPVTAFYRRRFFRIAPMFWCAAIGYLTLDALVVPFWNDQGTATPLAVLFTSMFIHGWLPQTINAVVPGGWSVADEMTFYLIFPLLVVRIDRLSHALVFLGICIAVALLANALAPMLYGPQAPHLGQFLYYWLPNQLPAFALGFVTLHLIPWARGISRTSASLLLAIALALLLATAFGGLPYTADIHHPAAWRDLAAGAAFMALILSLAAWPGRAFVNRATRLLGKLSFSVYLLQFGLIEIVWAIHGPMQISGATAVLVFGLAVTVLTSMTAWLATATYRWIEEPWMRRGWRRDLVPSTGSQARPA